MMGPIWAIARVNVTRMLRERANLFFVFVFPLLLVLLIGVSFGGAGSVTIAVVGPPDDVVVDDLVVAIDDREGLDAVRLRTPDLALDALSRGRVGGVLLLLEGVGTVDGVEARAELGFRDEARGAMPAVSAAIAEVVAPHRAADLARQLGASPTAVDTLRERDVEPAIEVSTIAVGDELDAEFASLGQFDLGASTQLILFVFITTLSGASRIVESRELGVTRRMMAAPVGSREVVLGEGLGRYLVALFQALWVIVGGLLLFSVDWGDPIAAVLVVAMFGLVAAAAAMLLGAVAKNTNQASGLGTLFGLTLAALGGCMAPLDIFSDTLRKVAHITPHAWANDAFADLTRRDGTIVDVLPELVVLAGFALVLGALATNLLRRQITVAS